MLAWWQLVMYKLQRALNTGKIAGESGCLLSADIDGKVPWMMGGQRIKAGVFMCGG